MTIADAFRNLVMMLLIEPTSSRVDELLAELAAQAALQIHQTNTTDLLLRCVRWDNPDVYYALDSLLNLYAFKLTAKPGPLKGTVILGITSTLPAAPQAFNPPPVPVPVPPPAPATGVAA